MWEELFPNCGAYEIIMMLHELHNRGYEQLRILSGMAPSGCYWRWSIYPKIAMGCNADAERKIRGVHCDCPYGSLGRDRSNEDYNEMADLFLEKYKSLFNVAKLPDKDYIKWFQGVVEHAQNNEFPIAYDDFFNAEEWEYMGGEALSYPPFEPTNSSQIPDNDVIAYAMDYFDEFSRIQLKTVLDYPYAKPSQQEIAVVIRQAINENKGLIYHIDEACWQALAYKNEDIDKKIQYEGEILLKMKCGDTIILKDVIELFAWSSE